MEPPKQIRGAAAPPTEGRHAELIKLRANLALADKADPTFTKPRVVLVSTGSFSPLHRMHVHVFDAAKAMLEKKNFLVVGGFLSPSHDDYVQGKLGNEAIPAVHRLAMIERALESSSWIAAEPWEATISFFVSFHQVVVEFDRYLRKNIQSPVQVMYLCGADLIIRCRYFTSLGPFPVVAIGRPGYSEKIRQKLFAEGRPCPLHFVDEDTENISSTLIRSRIQAGLPIDDLTFPAVVTYLKNNLSPAPANGNKGRKGGRHAHGPAP